MSITPPPQIGENKRKKRRAGCVIFMHDLRESMMMDKVKMWNDK
jgi:hypothetical protein